MTKFHEVVPRLCIVLACGGVGLGCGGSASETPPPLEPSTNPRAPYARTTRPSSQPAPQPQSADEPNAPAEAESADPSEVEAPEAEPPGPGTVPSGAAPE